MGEVPLYVKRAAPLLLTDTGVQCTLLMMTRPPIGTYRLCLVLGVGLFFTSEVPLQAPTRRVSPGTSYAFMWPSRHV